MYAPVVASNVPCEHMSVRGPVLEAHLRTIVELHVAGLMTKLAVKAIGEEVGEY